MHNTSTRGNLKGVRGREGIWRSTARRLAQRKGTLSYARREVVHEVLFRCQIS